MNAHSPDLPAARLQMVEKQLRRRGLKDERVLEAMSTVPRHEFVPPGSLSEAYSDVALPIGHRQTISQPYMVGLMLSLLEVAPEHRVLEVGAGSGYVAALLGQLAAEVWAVELVPALALSAEQTVERLGYGNVHVIAGDGTLGHPDAAPYDRIIVSAAAPEIPEPLAEQLVEGGKLVAPVGTRDIQTCLVCTRHEGALRRRASVNCVFVPLLGEHGWAR